MIFQNFSNIAFQSSRNKQMFSEICFEDLGLSKMSFIDTGLSSLAFEGKTTGMVIDWGEVACSVMPIFDG